MEMESVAVELERLDEGDHARIEGDEVDDGPDDVAQGDIATSAPGRYGDPCDLLSLHTGGDHRVAKQRLRDPEALHDPADPLPQRLAADAEQGDAADERRQRSSQAARLAGRGGRGLRVLGRNQGSPRAQESDEREHEPADEQAAVEPAELAVEREGEEGKRGGGGPD